MMKKLLITLLLILFISGTVFSASKSYKKPITLSIGYGSAYGGYGGFLQFNTTNGLSMHVTFGSIPTSLNNFRYNNPGTFYTFNFGIKYYLPFTLKNFFPYVDILLGIFDYEFYEVTDSWGTYSEYDVVGGLTCLIGGEWRFGFLGLNLSIGLISSAFDNMYEPSKESYFTFNTGVLVYF